MTRTQRNVCLFAAIVTVASVYSEALAYRTAYDDYKMAESSDVIFTYLNGSLGALIMVGSGILAFVLVCFGRFKTSALFFLLAVATFSARSLVSTWFNDTALQQDGGGSSSYSGNAGGYTPKANYNDARLAESASVGFSWFGSRERVNSPSRTLRNSAESYRPEPPRPKQRTSQKATTTFGLDVDTASYTNARRFLNTGQLPPREAIRPEEFINYFNYGYPEPTEVPLGVNFEMHRSPFDEGKHLLMVGVKAKSEPKVDDAGWNLVFLIDTSGSMQGSEKLGLVKTGLIYLIEQMKESDTLSVVTYADQVSTLLSGIHGTQRHHAIEDIRALRAGGSTNGAGGIQRAYSLARRHFKPGSVNRIVLATDGDFNVGVSSFEGLRSLIERERGKGVTLTTLGVGRDNLQDDKLELLADNGDGNYFYLDSQREARKVLGQDLYQNFKTVVRDAKIDLEFNGAFVKSHRLIGYENREMSRYEFNNDAKDAGDVGSGHEVTALIELELEQSNEDSDQASQGYYDRNASELAFLRMRYKLSDRGTSTLRKVPLPRSLATSRHQISKSFLFSSAVACFAEKLRGQKPVPCTYREIKRVASSGKGGDELGLRAEFVDLVETARRLQGE